MQFNSIAFLVFLPLVWAGYHTLRRPYARICFLLAASYLFYAWWRVDYTILLLASTLTDYTCSRCMAKASRAKRIALLLTSLTVNLSILIVFKYWTFLASISASVATVAHPGLEFPTLDLLLPLGVSFYTFQTISYTVDVYRGRIPAERNLINFALYVSFFPQLVAGPIERPSRLLPQIKAARLANASEIVSGLRLMLWGMFKKVVVADTLSIYVDIVYGSPQGHNGAQLMLATVFFAVQIYCDFSGYTDIAIGCARTLGFDLMKNFRRPYLAWSPTEFWRRWHISLSTWFRDYVYIPLGGSKCNASRAMFSLLATFLISGLWHGANWTFIIWGGIHGIFVLIERLISQPKKDRNAPLPLGTRLLGMTVTLACVTFAWIFFRANSLSDAWYVVTHLLTDVTMQGITCNLYRNYLVKCLLLILVIAIYECWEEKCETTSTRSHWNQLPTAVRWVSYWSVTVTILLFGQLVGINQFIYFQF